MASRPKLSGAALAAELSGLSYPDPSTVLQQEVQSDLSAEVVEPPSPSTLQPPSRPSGAVDRSRRNSQSVSRGGRPAKAGVDGIPVNVRLSQANHLSLAKLAAKLMVPGRPLPTVQDVVRSLIRGALGEPELALKLCRELDV